MFKTRRNTIFHKSAHGLDVSHPSGLRIHIRPLSVRDQQIHTEHLLRLSDEDRRKRFFQAMDDASIVRYSKRIDWDRSFILGAFVDDELRAVGSLMPIENDEAELAVTVEQAFQHAAIGRILVATLLVAARLAGLSAVRLIFLHENTPMRMLARDIHADLRSAQGVVEGVVPLTPAP